MLNSVSANVFNFSIVSKICLVLFFFTPSHFIATKLESGRCFWTDGFQTLQESNTKSFGSYQIPFNGGSADPQSSCSHIMLVMSPPSIPLLVHLYWHLLHPCQCSLKRQVSDRRLRWKSSLRSSCDPLPATPQCHFAFWCVNWNRPHFLIVSWLMEKKPISFIVSFSVRLYDFIYCFR